MNGKHLKTNNFSLKIPYGMKYGPDKKNTNYFTLKIPYATKW